MTHHLKIEAVYLDNLLRGIKKVEIRLNDRDYQKDDLLCFRDSHSAQFKEHLFEVTHIHSGLGLEKNYVAMSLTNFAAEDKSGGAPPPPPQKPVSDSSTKER